MRHKHQTLRALLPALVFAGCAASLAPVQASVHHALRHHSGLARTPRDSYLQYKVYSVEQLIQQVSDNPAVRSRFARHFQIPEARVVSYMRANLVESYVPKTGRYTVYCVRPSGRFYPVKQTFRQGTKVFALRNGEPVMKWVCGNPLSKLLPEVQVRNIPNKPRVAVKPSIQELTPAEQANILVPSEVATPVYQPLVPVSIASASAPLLVRAGGRSLLPFLLPVALIGVTSGGGGGHTPNIPITPAVPEAGTLAYLAAGAPVVLALARRRKAHRPR